jgi:hypothetical protein
VDLLDLWRAAARMFAPDRVDEVARALLDAETGRTAAAGLGRSLGRRTTIGWQSSVPDDLPNRAGGG